MMKRNIFEHDFWYYAVRTLLIVLYPLWLLLGLLESKDWKEFKDGAKLPFKRFGKRKGV